MNDFVPEFIQNALYPSRRNDRMRSETSRKRKYVRSSSQTYIETHSKLLPKAYEVSLETEGHRDYNHLRKELKDKMFVYHHKNIEFRIIVSPYSVLKLFSVIPRSTFQRSKDARINYMFLETAASNQPIFTNILRSLKSLKEATLSGNRYYDLRSNTQQQMLQSALYYLSRASDKFSILYRHAPELISTYKGNFLNMISLDEYYRLERIRSVLRYVAALNGLQLTNTVVESVAHLTHLKLLVNTQTIVGKNFPEMFWYNLAYVTSIEALCIEFDGRTDLFGEFTQCGASISSLARLQTLKLHFSEKSLDWCELLKHLRDSPKFIAAERFEVKITFAYTDEGLIEESVLSALCKLLLKGSSNGVRVSYQFIPRDEEDNTAEFLTFDVKFEQGLGYIFTAITVCSSNCLEIHRKIHSLGSNIREIGSEICFDAFDGESQSIAQEFIDASISLTSLERLRVNIYSYNVVNYSEFEKFLQAVGSFKTLRYLSVEFAFDYDMLKPTAGSASVEPPMRKLIQNMYELSELRELKLSLCGDRLGLQCIKELNRTLFSLPNFERFILDLGSIKNLRKNERESLLDYLNKIQGVQITDIEIITSKSIGFKVLSQKIEGSLIWKVEFVKDMLKNAGQSNVKITFGLSVTDPIRTQGQKKVLRKLPSSQAKSCL